MIDAFFNLRIMFAFFLAFIANKFLIRPVIIEHEIGEPWNTIVLSFPNFCEAIIGFLLLSNISIFIIRRSNEHFLFKPNYNFIYLGIIIFASSFVILEELKIHNLGGSNVYDKNDLIFSIAGIIISSIYLFIKNPKIHRR